MGCEMRPRYQLGVPVLAILLISPGFAVADWGEDYREGIQAIDQSRWSEAESLMARAARENPASSNKTVRIYGMRFEPYIPHYYLGLARYRLGDCAGALSAWEMSVNNGVVQGTSRFSELEDLRAECLQRIPKADTPTRTPTVDLTAPPVATPGPDPLKLQDALNRAESEIRSAEQIEGSLAPLRSNRKYESVWQQHRALDTEHRQAAELLASARNRLEQGRANSDLELLGEAALLAGRAQAALQAIPEKVELAYQGLINQRRTQTAVADAKQVTHPPPQEPEPESILPLQPPATMTPPPQLSRPRSLVDGVNAYFGGDFQRAASLLDGKDYPSARATAVAHLVGSASYWILFQEGGMEDESLRERAMRMAISCKRLDATIMPDEEAFAPAFLEFFSAVN